MSLLLINDVLTCRKMRMCLLTIQHRTSGLQKKEWPGLKGMAGMHCRPGHSCSDCEAVNLCGSDIVYYALKFDPSKSRTHHHPESATRISVYSCLLARYST